MGKNSLNLPATPTYYQNPFQTSDIGLQRNVGNSLISGNLSDQSGSGGANLSWLQSLVNPNFSAQAIQGAQASLLPQYNQNTLDIKNQAAASNALNSSTFTDALAKNEFNLNSQLQGIGLTQGIQDAYAANQNKGALFNTGLGLNQQTISNDQQDTSSQNNFNLENYSNQVAQAIAQQQNKANGNVFGNILSSFSPLAHDIYSGYGYNVPGMGVQQTALNLASIGTGGGLNSNSGIWGNGLGGAKPGSSAYNSKPTQNYFDLHNSPYVTY